MDEWSGFDEIFSQKNKSLKTVNYDGIFYKKFLENLIKKSIKFGNNDYFNLISDNVIRIYENLNLNKKIIAIGEVQSGKTENIIGTLNLALDNEWDTIIVMGGTTSLLFKQFQERFNENVPEKNDVIFYRFDPNSPSMNLLLSQNKKMIISIVKNATKIETIYQEIKNSDKSNRILILDDECDYMSLNVGVNKDSKIYSFIKKILQFPNSKYLGVTATPYGNLVSEKSDAIYPDAIIKLECDRTMYTGLDFFQKNNVYKVTGDSKKDESQDSILYNFTLEFVVKSTIASLFGLDYTRGLINIFLDTNEQEEIVKKLENEIIKKVLLDLKNEKIDIQKMLDENMGKIEISKDDFKNHLMHLFKNKMFCLQAINGKSKYVENHKFFIILVGGNLISRGITFENLICEVMINVRDKKQPVDTLLQRARWFGYRKHLLPLTNENFYFYNLMKVFINEPVLKALEEAFELNEYLYINLIDKNVCENPNSITDSLLEYKNNLETISYSDKE